MAALIRRMARVAGASDVYTWIGWGCAVGSVLLLVLIRTGRLH